MNGKATGGNRAALILCLLVMAVVFPGGALMAADWSQTPWQVNCVDPNPCAPVDDYYERYLRDISVWLDGLGFLEPRSAKPLDASRMHVDGIYVAEIKGLSPPLKGQGSLPVADPGPPAVPGAAAGDPLIDNWFKTQGDAVAALFIAVESSYGGDTYVHENFPSPQTDWMFRGMAIAARQAWLDQTSYNDTTEYYRSYAKPLQRPESVAAAMGTWHFWTEVGSQINSPEKIAWFHDVLSGSGGPNAGTLDEALRPHGGLATQLVKFFVKLSAQGLEVFDPYSHSARLPAGDNEKEFRFQHSVREVAGKGARVAVSSGTEETVKVEISIEPDHADLHLIVDGQRRDQGSGENRNRYIDELEGGASKTYEIVVANVAESVFDSADRMPALVVKLSTEEEVDCCSCEVRGVQQFTGGKILPCMFDHPEDWEGLAGDDRGLVSAVVGPACGASCFTGSPGIGFTVATRADSNAEVMEQVWSQIMPVAGTARCGDSTVTFYSPPGSDPLGMMGGVKFYVGVNGKKYAGAATFSCGEAGGWMQFQKLFIDSFRSYPGSTFPGD
jgi:hypothetical protein